MICKSKGLVRYHRTNPLIQDTGSNRILYFSKHGYPGNTGRTIGGGKRGENHGCWSKRFQTKGFGREKMNVEHRTFNFQEAKTPTSNRRL
jgi:hypothetical protein